MGFLLYDLYFDIASPLSPHNHYIVEVVMAILLVYCLCSDFINSRKHEQATCVPITLIDGAMINLIKTQKNTDGEYGEEMKTFK